MKFGAPEMGGYTPDSQDPYKEVTKSNVKTIFTLLGPFMRPGRPTSPELAKARGEAKKLVLATHPDRNADNPYSEATSKLATQLLAACEKPELLQGSALTSYTESLTELALRLGMDKASIRILIDDARREQKTTSDAHETGTDDEDSEESTEPEPNYEDPVEMAAHVEQLFDRLSEDRRSYGSAYHIQDALTEVCVKAARAHGLEDPEDIVDKMKAVDVTTEFSNPSGYDYEGNNDGDVILMGNVIARWGAMADGYSFDISDFKAPEFTRAYNQFIKAVDERRPKKVFGE